MWSPSVNWSQQTTVRQSIYRRLIGKLCVGGPGRNVSQQWSTYGPALSQPRSVSLREPEQCLTISYSDSNIATACSPRLLSSLVEKLRSKMCGQLRAASAGPLVSPSCLWFSVSWLITQQVDTLTATESRQDVRCDVQVCTTAADVAVELVSPRIARQVEHSPPTTTGEGRARSTCTGGQTCTPWGPRAVFRAGTRLWQGESRTRIWCRGWCSRRQ